jgi:hypothetical protein
MGRDSLCERGSVYSPSHTTQYKRYLSAVIVLGDPAALQKRIRVPASKTPFQLTLIGLLLTEDALRASDSR